MDAGRRAASCPPGPARRGRRAALALLGAVVLLGALYAVSPVLCSMRLEQEMRGPGPAASEVVLESDGTLVLSGEIDMKMAAAARRILATDGAAVRRVALDSPGGIEEAAGRIGLGLIKAGLRPVVAPRGALCASACFLVFETSIDRRIDDESLFVFHGARRRIGFEDCPWCRFVERTHPMLAVSRGEREVMRNWARAFSPRLVTFLDACPTDPFASDDGVALTGAELKAVRDGTASFTCADLPPQRQALRRLESVREALWGPARAIAPST